MSGELSPPVVMWMGNAPSTAPLVVLFHGRGDSEHGIAPLADLLPKDVNYVAVRGPIPLDLGFGWFANRGIGRPLPASLSMTISWFQAWLRAAVGDREIVLIGFSGGAAFASALALVEPKRYLGVGVLSGTLPFDAGVPITPSRLSGVPIFFSQGASDSVIPLDLQRRSAQYLAEESGAELTISTDAEGHAISAIALQRLSAWIAELTSSATANAHHARAAQGTLERDRP